MVLSLSAAQGHRERHACFLLVPTSRAPEVDRMDSPPEALGSLLSATTAAASALISCASRGPSETGSFRRDELLDELDAAGMAGTRPLATRAPMLSDPSR